MKLNEFFSSVGGDYGEAKARFQSDERIARFLKCFRAMTVCRTWSAAVSANDAPTAFRAVHTLKGVAPQPGARRVGRGQLQDDGGPARQRHAACRSGSSTPRSTAEYGKVRDALEQLEV